MGLDIPQLARQIQQGERAALSRGITLVESSLPAHKQQAQHLLQLLDNTGQEKSGAIRRLGITGSPGAGKSTFIEQLGQTLLAAGKKLAVLAIDPSSTRTGGSILGDKTRMPVLSRDPGAFVRPSPAGKTLGGLANATRQAVLLCEAAGFTDVIIETVGVGQSEHAVRDLCDCMVLLVLPGSGDSLQGIKRGIVELADLVVVNKADGEREALAKQTRRDYQQALHLQPVRQTGWSPTAVLASSLTSSGLNRFGESLEKYYGQLGLEGLAELRNHQRVRWFERTWGEQFVAALSQVGSIEDALIHAKTRISAGQTSDIAAAMELTKYLLTRFSA